MGRFQRHEKKQKYRIVLIINNLRFLGSLNFWGDALIG